MARPDSQTTCWQCNKLVDGEPCGGGNTIRKTICRNDECGKERSRGDFAMSIMDVTLGVFTSRDDIDYDDTATSFGNVATGTEGVVYDSPYHPAPQISQEKEEVKISKIGRCYENDEDEKKQ